jgi:hypothetical protein
MAAGHIPVITMKLLCALKQLGDALAVQRVTRRPCDCSYMVYMAAAKDQWM